MTADSDALRERGVSSLMLAIELFNRPFDRGRTEAVLILFHHSFEMLLKALIVAKDGKPCIDERGYSHSFDKCLHVAHEDMSLITVDQRRFLTMLDNLRDSAVHYYQTISEDLLYLFSQASVSLFGKLLEDGTGQDLRDHIPERVLPIFCRPPKDIHRLIADEFAKLRLALRESKITRAQAAAALRPLVAFAIGGAEMPRRMTAEDVETRISQLERGEDWHVVFPEVAQLRLETEREGIKFGARVVRDSANAMPVRVIKEGDEVPEGFLVAKEINVFDKFNIGLIDLARKLGVTPPKTLALVRKYNVNKDPDAFREIRVGRTVHRRYSKRALDVLAPHAEEAQAVWDETKALRRKKPR